MLTKEQMSILDKQYGQACADNNKLKTPWEGVRWAAEWGINSATSEIARLKAEKAELIDWLKEAIIQLNYMQQKFGETGSGNAVISGISALIETYGKK